MAELARTTPKEEKERRETSTKTAGKGEVEESGGSGWYFKCGYYDWRPCSIETWFYKRNGVGVILKEEYKKAYDRVSREELWYCMRNSGVSEKYVRVAQDMYEDSPTAGKCAVGMPDWFMVGVGLHQGSALNPFPVCSGDVQIDGRETVVLSKRQEVELEVAELKMLMFLFGLTPMYRIRNEFIRGTAHVGRFGDKDMAQTAGLGRKYLKAFVSGFFVAVPVTVTVLDRLAYVARVEGASMQPSLNPEGTLSSDVVLLNRWSVRNYEVQRGDIVSVVSPIIHGLSYETGARDPSHSAFHRTHITFACVFRLTQRERGIRGGGCRVRHTDPAVNTGITLEPEAMMRPHPRFCSFSRFGIGAEKNELLFPLRIRTRVT
ncbi:mitochondrial inner membrane protease subunit 2 [Silurus meridionalis]|nr:mitochondrial inner membrane protease subunit 2 [Silurus meridionalis]